MESTNHVSVAKKKLIQQMLKGNGKRNFNQIKRRPVNTYNLLSCGQQRLWFLNQFDSETPLYNISLTFQIEGVFNSSAFIKSINKIVERHEILRTRFVIEKEEPVQLVLSETKLDISFEKIDDYSEISKDVLINSIIKNNSSKIFDLSQSPLFSIKIIKFPECKNIINICFHHIIFDGWSQDIFLKELTELYEYYSKGKEHSLKELPIQYADFSYWQREWLKGEELNRQLSYWKNKLSGDLPILQLPTDFPRPAKQTFNGDSYTFEIPSDLTQKLKDLSKREGVTLYMTLLAAYKVLLYRYTGQKDILVGTPIAGRNREELEELIGFFVNTLVIRTDLSENPDFIDYLKQVREACLEAYSHQDVPFERIVEELNPERNDSYSPVFQTFFKLENSGNKEGLSFHDLKLRMLDNKVDFVKNDLLLLMEDNGDHIKGELQFNTNLFEESTIKRIVYHYIKLLSNIVSGENHNISSFNILTEDERALFLVNQKEPFFVSNQGIHQKFEQQVRKKPYAIAVMDEGISLTYVELNEKANQLAHYLKEKGVQKEKLIGISMERSVDMVIAILGVLKVGRAYVPLDPSYPQERLEYMLKDSKLDIVITKTNNAYKFNENIQTILMNDLSELNNYSVENPSVKISSNSLAYVIYTSGSTGTPKGVMIEHKGICNLAEFQAAEFDITNNDRILQFASTSFDASVWEIFMALTTGATLCVLPQSSNTVELDIGEYIDKYAVTTCTLPPSVLSILSLDKVGSLKKVIVAGESCPIELAKKWSKGRQFWNAYGPTESTVCTTTFEFHEECEKLPIGKPISNTKVYVLDSNMQLVPIGVPGELYVSGVGIARGYWNRPELTRERFIKNPFDPKGEECLYKTGDLVKYLPDGNIEFLGRLDQQVKIRGFRIELEEIERVLLKHPKVLEAIVVVHENAYNDKRLVAYIVPSKTENIVNEVRSFLQEKLPNYMLPSNLIPMEEFKLTSNGKIDRSTLITPDRLVVNEHYIAPRTPVEELLVEVWKEVLHVSQICIRDNFFELGGHSLLITKIILRIQREIDIKIPVKTFFENPTIENLSVFLEEKLLQEYDEANE